MLEVVDVGVESLQLGELLLDSTKLSLKRILLQHRLLVDILRIGQVVDHHLVLVMPILELENMVCCFILTLFSLLYDGQRVNVLADFKLSVRRS